jgi:hypothetical protein
LDDPKALFITSRVREQVAGQGEEREEEEQEEEKRADEKK